MPGDVVELRSTAETRATNQIALAKTREVEVVQLRIPAGSAIPTYEAAGEVILHCLEGRVRICVLSGIRELRASQLVFVPLLECPSDFSQPSSGGIARLCRAPESR
jgi:quercetin dioxygenase-like cupin family protein